MRSPWAKRLRARGLTLQVLVLLAALVAGVTISFYLLHRRLDNQLGQQAIDVAARLATQPLVSQDLAAGLPGGSTSAPAVLANSIRRATDANAVIIANDHGVLYADATSASHRSDLPEALRANIAAGGYQPNLMNTAPAASTQGGTVWGITPVRDSHGSVIGEVAVGLADSWRSGAASPVSAALLGLGIGMVIGIIGLVALGRRLRQRLLGLEPDELAVLYFERDATLRTLQEGVLGFDCEHRVRFANDEAARLLGLAPQYSGRSLDELVPAGRLHELLRGGLGDTDNLVVVNEQVVVATHTPIFLHGHQIGSVVTLRDRTEPESLLRELDSVLGLTEALRAQAHEFSNRLHTIVGLVELGRYDDAVRFVTDVSTSRNEFTDLLVARLRNPMVVALLLAKATVASERHVTVRLDERSDVPGVLIEPGETITVLGNLLDNAIDAAAPAGGGSGWVSVKLLATGADLTIEVADSGPGIPEPMRTSVFVDGVTSKDSTNGARRGLGLAIVRQVVQSRGGSITVTGDQGAGAVFTALLPDCTVDPTRAQDELTAR